MHKAPTNSPFFFFFLFILIEHCMHSLYHLKNGIWHLLMPINFLHLCKRWGEGNFLIFSLICVVLYTNFPRQIYLLLSMTGCLSSDRLSKRAEQLLTQKHCACGCPVQAKKKTDLPALFLNSNKRALRTQQWTLTNNYYSSWFGFGFFF